MGTRLTSRTQAFASLTRSEGFDLAVVGGGATGLAVALQAAWAGRSVALIEAHDFASGTSSRSTKLLHGGVRYLAQGEISLVREALHERKALIDLAPDLAHPIRFVMPAYRWWERLFYGAGLVTYDWLAGTSSLGKTEQLSRAAMLSRYPAVATHHLRGAVSYCDAQFDDAGLAIAMARGAAAAGAVLLNRVQATAVTPDTGGLAVALTDRFNGTSGYLKARDVVNAAGVWVDGLRGGAPMVQPSQGAHIVVDRRFHPADDALLLPRTADGRVLFVVPWLGYCVIGTTDTPRDPADVDLGREPLPFSAEIDLILSEAARLLSPAPTRADILSAWAGLRPLVKPSATTGSATHRISREHAIEVEPNGLVTITGGKWTTCLAMARDALRALPQHPFEATTPPGITLPSGMAALASRAPSPAEVAWLADHTWASTVEDVLARRSRLLFLDVASALAAAPLVASALEARTGRDADLAGFQLTAHAWMARFRQV